MTGQLVDPQPSTDNPPNPFIVPQPCELQDPEVAADTSGYDSSEAAGLQVQREAVLRTCQIIPQTGDREVCVEVCISIPYRIASWRSSAIVWWISEDPNIPRQSTRFQPSVSLPPNLYTVFVKTPVWPKTETVTVKVVDATDHTTELGITRFTFTGTDIQHPLQTSCPAPDMSGNESIRDMLGKLKDVTEALGRVKFCDLCNTSFSNQKSASHGSGEMTEPMVLCVQCSSILDDSTILLQQLVAMQSSLETYISHGSHKQLQADDPCYPTANLIPSSENPPPVYDEIAPLSTEANLRPSTTGLSPPSEVHMSGQKFEEILRDVLAYKVTVDKAVEMVRTYTYLPAAKVVPSKGTDAKKKSTEKPKRRKISAAKRGLLKLLKGGLPKKQQNNRKRSVAGISGSSDEVVKHQKPSRPRRRKGSHVKKRKKGHVEVRLYEELATDQSSLYNASLTSNNRVYAEPVPDQGSLYNTSLSSNNRDTETGYNASKSSQEYEEVQVKIYTTPQVKNVPDPCLISNI
jgi:hypothetical protein